MLETISDSIIIVLSCIGIATIFYLLANLMFGDVKADKPEAPQITQSKSEIILKAKRVSEILIELSAKGDSVVRSTKTDGFATHAEIEAGSVVLMRVRHTDEA